LAKIGGKFLDGRSQISDVKQYTYRSKSNICHLISDIGLGRIVPKFFNYWIRVRNLVHHSTD
jgi:hypothetical protein